MFLDAETFYCGLKIDTAGGRATEEQIKEEAERLEKDGTAVNSICGLVSQIGMASLDRERVVILAHVVNSADEIVSLMAKYLASEGRKIYATIARNELISLQEVLSKTVGFQNYKESKKYFKSVEASVLQKKHLNDILLNNPENVFLSMAEAHQKLKAGINNPETQLVTAIESLQKFFTSAQAAHEAIKAISEDKENE